MKRTELILHLATHNLQEENSTPEKPSVLEDNNISETLNDAVILAELKPVNLNPNSSSLDPNLMILHKPCELGPDNLRISNNLQKENSTPDEPSVLEDNNISETLNNDAVILSELQPVNLNPNSSSQYSNNNLRISNNYETQPSSSYSVETHSSTKITLRKMSRTVYDGQHASDDENSLFGEDSDNYVPSENIISSESETNLTPTIKEKKRPRGLFSEYENGEKI
ncbi:uncharacterized protein DDB_G0280579-like [Diabrotica virgifera virgifera]|uniref:Uncharacterized protein DDB_G0280579-like n=1 Tax=Diabrotica virgifera virgifera TaxID=50390 RepID=A0A6P7FEX6_DIAVI|nr:uncharacterized protein DDB_G0280579-like [Diabrotica virgifera virgifera]